MKFRLLKKAPGLFFGGLVMIAGVMENFAQSIPDSAEKVQPLLVGAQIPDVSFKKPDGSNFDLRKAAANKPVILIFYRGGWWPYCNTQLGQLRKIEPQLTGLGYQIVAVSPDKPEKLSASIEKQNLTYALVSDSEAIGIKEFGIAFRVSDQTFDTYKNKFKLDLEEHSGAKHHLLPVPAVFIIGKTGQILFQYVNPDYKVRLYPEILLAAAKAYVNKWDFGVAAVVIMGTDLIITSALLNGLKFEQECCCRLGD
jgi:peroxiredoxin